MVMYHAEVRDGRTQDRVLGSVVSVFVGCGSLL